MFAVIHLPDFSLQAVLRLEPELRPQPVALVDPESAKTEIVQRTAAAKQAGIMPGLTPSQAQARCGGVIFRRISRAQEKSATELLLQTAYAFSPNIEATEAGVCTMDLKGLGLETGEARRKLGERIVAALAQFHLDARVGIAVTPGLALLAARAAESVSVIEDAEAFAHNLPIHALGPAEETAEILQRWGIRAVGELLALSRDSVAERLGPEALELFKRVSPRAARPLKLVAVTGEFAEEMEFEREIETVEPLLFVLRRFVEQLAARLEALHFVVAEFELRLGLASGAKHERAFKIPSPTARLAVLFRMLQTHLETVRTDSPIVSLRLVAVPARPQTHQFGLFDSALRDPNQFAETLARLTALCGADRAGTPHPLPVHRPDSFRMERPEFDSPKHDEARKSPAVKHTDGPALRRFRPPQPIYVEFREARPSLMRGEVFNGVIAGARGPFLSSGDWWDNRRWSREEWDVKTSGGPVLRIFLANGGCYVEGVYD